MWNDLSIATTRTVSSSLPGSGIIGWQHTQHLGANFLSDSEKRNRMKTEKDVSTSGVYVLVKVLNAVYLIGGINSERDSIQAFTTHDATEALRVIWLSGGP